MNSNFSCNYCDKGYTRKTAYTRHVILCEILNQSPRLKKCEKEESEDIPTVKQLYQIIQELAIKCCATEQKMAEMQKWVQKTKKKLNVIEWLNTNYIPTTNFTDWTSELQVKKNHIDLLINESMIQTVFEIIKDSLQSDKNPIYCFTQKTNLFYYYDTKWQQILPEDFIVMIKRIHHKILAALLEWNTENSEEIRKSEKLQLVYNKTVIKLMSATFEKESLFINKIKSELYGYMKTDIKDVIEYEFEF